MMKLNSLICAFFLCAFLSTAFAQYKISGFVKCEGHGIRNVVVSCGDKTILSDSLGYYQLDATTGDKYVQISIPKGYLVKRETTVPVFYHLLDEKQSNYDFELIKNPKDDINHLFFVQADVQVTSGEELDVYRKEIVNDIYKTFEKNNKLDVFGLDLGDIVGDTPSLFPEYINAMSLLPFPFFRTIGNHDMHYWGRSHETSETHFNKYFGPTVYSFNKGNVHYIVLNNNFFIGRDYFYMGYVDERTFRWLEQDLAHVPKNSLVFVMTHIPLQLQLEQKPFTYNFLTMAEQTINSAAVLDLFKGYNTHILSGHTHYNLNIVHHDKLFEHNTAAACGAWWQADICTDGTPRGYAVYEVKGNEVKWHYKSAGFDKSYQFRSYRVKKDDADTVIVNVWNYDPSWKVEWLENGKIQGEMQQYSGYDPLVVDLCADKTKFKYNWINPSATSHLFKANIAQGNAKIAVKVTDRFGNIYQETVK